MVRLNLEYTYVGIANVQIALEIERLHLWQRAAIDSIHGQLHGRASDSCRIV